MKYLLGGIGENGVCAPAIRVMWGVVIYHACVCVLSDIYTRRQGTPFGLCGVSAEGTQEEGQHWFTLFYFFTGAGVPRASERRAFRRYLPKCVSRWIQLRLQLWGGCEFRGETRSKPKNNPWRKIINDKNAKNAISAPKLVPQCLKAGVKSDTRYLDSIENAS